jgi:hypothetical protein
MRPISASATIDAPRESVFGLLVDLGIRSSFIDHFMTELRLERLDPVGVGAAARFRLRDSNHWFDTVIDETDFPYMVRERGQTGRSNRVPTFTVWELAEGPSPDGCEATVTFWTEPATHFDRAREHLIRASRLRRDFKRALLRLRDVAEGDAQVERIGVAGRDGAAVVYPG